VPLRRGKAAITRLPLSLEMTPDLLDALDRRRVFTIDINIFF